MIHSEDSPISAAMTAPLGSVDVALTPLQRFEEYVQSRGLRNTKQKKYLVEQVFAQHQHFDADQLMEQLPRKGRTDYVSRPTVYRALKEFVDAGLLRTFELDGRAVYELDYGYPQHDHMYCVKCQALIEFQSSDLLALRNAVAKDHRFRVQTHRLVIEGICEACSRSRSRTRRAQDRV
jgi:Fur family transcriptional regulator, ferric uptake regulator